MAAQFACLLATCSRFFSSPKTRRLHLIDAHAYPKEYFFAVVNKGVGGLLKRWGDGASLLRGEWKGRSADSDGDEENEDDDMEVDAKGRHPPPHLALPKKKPQSSKAHPEIIEVDMDHELDALTSQMTSLELGIPPAIRFGRGGKSGGFGNTGDGGVGAGVGLGPGTNHPGTGAARGRGSGRAAAPTPSIDVEAVTHMIPAQVRRNAKARGAKSPPTSPVLARMPAQATAQPLTMSARGRDTVPAPAAGSPRGGAPVRGRGASVRGRGMVA
ncbi:hypothetical protein FIBSPDRAFT_947544 [Athelia psychrophila]|uniref:C2H2-type domain-containing protein n=1 Tax=Athelia psychrophila TaxID=1759441 RepID=A0A166RVY4_9AGAM|nr:hypothetical protein FIBSPDRAFT_947544 [Fibularhizoctonia sp. CBS 109695]